ncbi:MAG: hypothetical protein NTY51_02195 [Deltaproteobacteria bacterium]|nr:hypothetical protein [Deltaproteobacteria bacterium]
MITKPRLWENRSLVLGILFLLLGLFVSVMAFSKLRELLNLFWAYLPFSIPGDVFERTLKSLPLVFSIFVSLVSSIAGLLFGLQWFFSGMSEAFRKKHGPETLGELEDKNSLISYLLTHELPSSNPALGRFLVRWFTPGTRRTIWTTLISNLKLICIMILIWLLAKFLLLVPKLLNQSLGLKIAIIVPDFVNLWSLLALIIMINIFVAFSFISIRKTEFHAETHELLVSGHGAMVFFLAIIEEMCRLVNLRTLSGDTPSRFQSKGPYGTQALASLFEGYTIRQNRPANLWVYVLFPVAACCLIWGFNGLINFQFMVPSTDHHLFFSRYFPVMLLEVAFYCFLLYAAFHFIRIIRLIFEIAKFESYVIACKCEALSSDDLPENRLGRNSKSRSLEDTYEWKELCGPEDNLIEWVKQPQGVQQFSVMIASATARTETSFHGGSRFVTSLEQSMELKVLIEKIINVLSSVNFRIKEVPATDHSSSAETP